MDNLHGPREYLELRDLPVSKTFVMMQSYRVPLQILPLDFGQQPLDPADEYIHSNRIVESRSTKQFTPSSFNTTSERSANKRPKTRGSRQRKRVEGEGSSRSESEPDYPVDNTSGSSGGGAYYDSSMTPASQSFLPPLPVIVPTPLPSTPTPLYHSYSTRGRDRSLREQIHQQQQLESWTSSPNNESTTVKGKKRKMPLSRSLAMETEHTSVVKIEKPSPSMRHSYLFGRSTENGAFFQQHGMGVENEEMGRDQHGLAPEMSTSTLAMRGTRMQVQEFLQAINSNPLLDDIEDKVHGYNTVEGEKCLGTSSMSTTIGSATNDALAHARSAIGSNGGHDQTMSAYPYQDGSHWQQGPVSSRHQQQQQFPWDHEAHSQMNARKAYYGLYPAQQYSLPYYEPQPQFQTTDDSQYQTPQQQTFSNDSIAYYDAAHASTATLPPMHEFQGSYGYHTEEYGQPLPIGSTTHSATMSDVSHNEGDLEMGPSDEAGYSPFRQSTPHPERGDSPWTSESAYTRSSSLSTSLTLSPVMRSEASGGRDSGPTAELKSGCQPWTDAVNISERHDVGGTCWPTVRKLSYDDEPPTEQLALGEEGRDSTTTASCNYQGHTVSVSFIHCARSSTSHLAAPQTPLQASADTVMLTPAPDLGHRGDPSASTASSMQIANYGRQDHQELSSPSQENPQLQAHSFQTSVPPCRRTSQQPYVPVMSFSSETILGTSPVDSHQGSPTTPRWEIMDSAVSRSETQIISGFSEVEVEELSNRGQEVVATGENEDEDGYFIAQMQASPSLETPAHTPSECPFTGEATTSATMTVFPFQRSYHSAAAGPSGATTTKSPPLPHQSDIGTYSSEPEPYSLQLRREYRHPPSFLFHDLDDRDEFDRMLEYHSHQVETLEEHDQGEEGLAMEGHKQDGDGRVRDTVGYDDHEVSGQTFHQTSPRPIHARTGNEIVFNFQLQCSPTCNISSTVKKIYDDQILMFLRSW